MTCGHVLADKWNWYAKECENIEDTEDAGGTSEDARDKKDSKPRSRGELLDKLGLTRICCRRHFLGHVDMMDLI